MYSISPYLFRSYNKNIMGPQGRHYSRLDDISGYDLFTLLDDFIKKYASYEINDNTKQVYRFENVFIDQGSRTISVWFVVGTYGIKTDIIDIDTGLVNFRKAENNAEMIKYYMHFFIPVGFDEAIVLTSNYRSSGVKTLFYSLFSKYFSSKTKQKLQMNTLSYDKAFNSWLDARMTEIRCTKFNGCKDITDQLTLLGHQEQELVIKPQKNKSLGRLRDFIGKGDKLEAIEVLFETSAVIKSVVELDGKKRTFRIGEKATNVLCEIELDDTVVMTNGVPVFSSMQKWSEEIVKEYAQRMYPGLSIG
ncbi:hypothetical protein [Gilliamella sp. Occ4-3]|uniref:hypothetical protein n=1 Tax=Gilliamella sp. Occ4-3 TaxID=3120254 RepID=UPI00080DFC3C|nr:hypothetical protein [Gilliamella apicola]OCG77934.1 hypothetical protein A9G44_03130 [Gilliamella apicola]